MDEKNRKYYWIKLKEDFFDDDTIQFLEEQDNGIAYVNFYLKLCLKSLKTEGSLIRLIGENLIPYDVRSLARLTGVDVDTVRCAMTLFEKIGLITKMNSGELQIAQFSEMIGKETRNAAIMRRKRAAEKINCNNVTPMLSERYTETRDKRQEIRDIDTREKEKNISCQQIVDLYHSICNSYSRVVTVSEKRKREIGKILKSYSIDQIKSAFTLAENSEFLKGGSDRGFKANFDWLTNENNMAKVLNGQYNNNTKSNRQGNYMVSELSFVEPEYYKNLNTELSPEEKEIAGDPLTPEEQEYLNKKREEGEWK